MVAWLSRMVTQGEVTSGDYSLTLPTVTPEMMYFEAKA